MPTAPDPVEVIEGALDSMRIQSAFKTSDHLNAARYLLAALEAAGLSVAELEQPTSEYGLVSWNPAGSVWEGNQPPSRCVPLYVVKSGRVAPPKAEHPNTTGHALLATQIIAAAPPKKEESP